VIILENRALYEVEDEVPEEPIPIVFGRGRIVREGTDVTVVGASLMVYEASRAAAVLSTEHGISVEIIDPRTVRPLDEETILNSVRKTGRLVVVDTSWAKYGFAAEVAALAAEKALDCLKAPVLRVTPPDCPAPVSKPLEEAFHPGPTAIIQACLQVLRSALASTRRISDIQERFTGPY
jgi:pyruvate dehydrogenase E1 component beta subunit